MATGKRSFGMMNDQEASPELNKRHQSSFRRNTNGSIQQQEYLFRILCPEPRVDAVIGKAALKTLKRQTGAKIKVDDLILGCDERVIHIGSPDSDDEDSPSASTGSAGLERDEQVLDEYTDGREVGPAQLALFKLHMRMLDEEDRSPDPSDRVVIRMLVPENQVGCLLGKRGKIIEQMRGETSSHIRILPREHPPQCAQPSDEVVQVVGDRPSVRKALNAISTRLLDNPPKDRDRPSSAAGFNASRGSQHNDSFFQPPPVHIKSRLPRSEVPSIPFVRPTAPSLSEYGGGRHSQPLHNELIFRVLVPNDKLFAVLGKAGAGLQSLRDDTGAKISVPDFVHGSDERVVIVAAEETPLEDMSPAQEALFHIQERLREESDSDTVITRLLVPSNQVGCLLGKGGTIITDMRKSTRANIRVFSKEGLPPCALDNDEIVQIMGEIRLARDALVKVTSRLRANLYREKDSRDDYGYQRSPSPLGYTSFGLQGSQSSSMQDTRNGQWLMQNDRLVSNWPDRPSLPPSSSLGTQSVVTCTKIEVFIPDDALLSVLGPNGSNLAQISKLSGARVNLNGDGKNVIEISGTPDETTAAKSLVEAYVAIRS